MKDDFNDWSTGCEILDMLHAYSLGLKDGKKEAFVDRYEGNVIEEVADDRANDDV